MWQHLPQYQTTLPIRLRRCPSIPTCLVRLAGYAGRCGGDAADGAVAETHDCDARKPLIILAESRVAITLPCFTLHRRSGINIKAMPFGHYRVWRGDIRQRRRVVRALYHHAFGRQQACRLQQSIGIKIRPHQRLKDTHLFFSPTRFSAYAGTSDRDRPPAGAGNIGQRRQAGSVN